MELITANETELFPDREVSSPICNEEPTVDLVSVLRTLILNTKTILAIGLLTFAVCTAIAFSLPFKYTSTTSFVPPGLTGGSSMGSLLGSQLAGFGGGDLLGLGKSSADLYSGILQSRSITGDLVKRFDLVNVYKARKESQAEAILKGSTKIVTDPKSSIISVSVTASTPQLAQKLASGYMDALQETNGRLALSQASQRRMFFEQQLAHEKDNLEQAEVDLKKTQEQSGMIAPTGQTAAEIQTIADTQAQIAGRQVQLAALLKSATEQNSDVIRLRSEIADLEQQLEQLQKGKTGQSPISIPTSQVPELQLEYLRKEREVKYHEALFEILSKQYEAARLDEARESPVIQVLDTASLPDSKSSPKRLYIMVGGLFAGLFLGCTWVLFRPRITAFYDSLHRALAA